MRKPDIVNMVLPNSDGKILLLHHKTRKTDRWELPGGKREQYETAEQAAVRECQEELGVETTVIRSLGRHAVCRLQKGEALYEWLLGSIVSGRPEAVEDIHRTAEYVDLSSHGSMYRGLSPSAALFAWHLQNSEVTLEI